MASVQCRINPCRDCFLGIDHGFVKGVAGRKAARQIGNNDAVGLIVRSGFDYDGIAHDIIFQLQLAA